MIEFVEGALLRRSPALAVVLVGGVAFRLRVPLSTSSVLPESGKVRLYTQLLIRDTEFSLYGFASEAERSAFGALCRVNGVGPQTALSILSGTHLEELSRAIQKGDTTSLRQIKGVGRKTAEKIIVELRNTLAASSFSGTVPSSLSLSDNGRDAIEALVQLGYSRPQAQDAVARATRNGTEPDSLESLVKESLRQILA